MRGVGVGVGVGVSVNQSSSTTSREVEAPPSPVRSGDLIPNIPTNPGQWLMHLNAQHGTSFDPASSHDRRKAWPIFTAWCNAGLSTAQIDAAIARAQAEATEPIGNLVAYADRVLASSQVRAAAYDRSWRRSNQAIDAKARELGITAARNENDYQTFADRLEAEDRRRHEERRKAKSK